MLDGFSLRPKHSICLVSIQHNLECKSVTINTLWNFSRAFQYQETQEPNLGEFDKMSKQSNYRSNTLNWCYVFFGAFILQKGKFSKK